MFLDLIPLHALQVCFVRARDPHSSEAGCIISSHNGWALYHLDGFNQTLIIISL